jgi:hypothetical protein
VGRHLRQAQGPGDKCHDSEGKWVGTFGKLRDRGTFGTVSEPAELAVKFRDRGSSFSMVSELAELPDISCTRVKDTAWVINAKNGTPHTRR